MKTPIKKTLAVILATLMMTGLAACGKKPAETTATTVPERKAMFRKVRRKQKRQLPEKRTKLKRKRTAAHLRALLRKQSSLRSESILTIRKIFSITVTAIGITRIT